MKVLKHSGALAEFNKNKLEQSLLRSGAGQSDVEQVMATLEQQMYDGIPTRKIYKLAGGLLKKIAAPHAARYNLRSALQMLGPAGFFFEKFVARVYAAEGFQTRTNAILQGKCVSHEIDVLLRKENQITMIECKFHGSNAGNSDVKVPMYILSRFNDLKVNSHEIWQRNETIDQCLIATNNRFTSDAIAFARCSGLELIGWDYPKDSLKSKIDTGGLYPITCLTTLSRMEKEKLLILDVILVKELIGQPDGLHQIGLSTNRQMNVIAEATSLCNYF